MILSERIQAFLALERQTCQLLEPDSVQALALAAVRFYAGYGHLNVTQYKPPETPTPSTLPTSEFTFGIDDAGLRPPRRLIDPDDEAEPIAPMTSDDLINEAEVTESDWAIIRPLFLLYIEREQALMLESTRVMGADVFGRASSEIAGDITIYENELGRKAFIQPVLSI